MKAYKASYKGKCRELTYEVGKTFSIDKFELCKHGFHFCENMNDVIKYYPYNNDFVLFEVEALGQIITEGNKSVTNKLKIIRIVPKEEYTFELPLHEYDQNNNLIHYKDPNGNEEWKEFDQNNNLIHYKYSNGYEYWNEYDQNNNLIHCKDSYGIEYWKEYDQNNNCIHYKYSNGYEEWKEYDQNNNLIYYKDSYGLEYSITIL